MFVTVLTAQETFGTDEKFVWGHKRQPSIKPGVNSISPLLKSPSPIILAHGLHFSDIFMAQSMLSRWKHPAAYSHHTIS